MPQAARPFHLVLLIHAHQPAGNFQHVFEECYKNSYDAFLTLLEKHPKIHLALHYSGPLLLWIEKNHPEYFARLRKLASSGQVELVGGGFYEPILVSIPPPDQVEQITRLADYIETNFGKRPGGAWLAERVWEPQLPSSLAAANVGYTLVDDLPFLAAGFEPEELFGSYIAEDRGKSVWLFPGLKELRYLIPFRKVEESIEFLKRASEKHPGGAAFFGDDMEKFGVWPGTFEHCYTDGWLENFFCGAGGKLVVAGNDYAQRLHREASSTWARRSAVGLVRGNDGMGAADGGSPALLRHSQGIYRTARCAFVHARRLLARLFPEICRSESVAQEDAARFGLRGFDPAAPFESGSHRSGAGSAGFAAARVRATTRTGMECSGGIYAPHLRTEHWRNLVRAETLADQLTPGGMVPRVELLDYDADGAPELLFTAPEYQALLKPSDGATLAAFDFRPAGSTLINSILRRPEAYHTRLREAASAGAANSGAVSIHDQVRVKEPNLERFLRYDRFPRHSFRALLFDLARDAAGLRIAAAR